MIRRPLFVIAVAAVALTIGGLAVIAQAPPPAENLSPASPSGPGFTYQGLLNKNVAAYDGTCNMQFSLWDSLSSSTGQVGITQTLNTVGVSNGHFMVLLNGAAQFGANAFNGSARWLQIGLQCAGDSSFVMLTRQLLSATPYALYSNGNWGLNGNAGTTPGNVLGTIDNQPLAVETNGVERMRLDTFGHLGVGNTFPTRTLDVNGKIGIFDGVPLKFGGLSTELAAQLINYGINDGPPNRFGGRYDSGVQGGLIRVDTRSGSDLFQFLGRPAGSTADASVVASVNSAGRVFAGAGFSGRCRADSNLNGGPIDCNQDVAEAFASSERTEPGDAVALVADPAALSPAVRRAVQSAAARLVGVVSNNPGLVFDQGQTRLAGDNSQLITSDKTVVAVVGRVLVKVSLENGPIAVGDPLTSSKTPGVVMKAALAGQILGYALQSSDQMTQGRLLLWLQPGLYMPPQEVARLNDDTIENDGSAQLQAQIDQTQARGVALEQQLAGLQQQNAALEARLKVLEQASQSGGLASPSSYALAAGGWLIAATLLLMSLLLALRPRIEYK